MDPELLANDDRLVSVLSAAGLWGDEEEVDRQLEQVERAAMYPRARS